MTADEGVGVGRQTDELDVTLRHCGAVEAENGHTGAPYRAKYCSEYLSAWRCQRRSAFALVAAVSTQPQLQMTVVMPAVRRIDTCWWIFTVPRYQLAATTASAAACRSSSKYSRICRSIQSGSLPCDQRLNLRSPAAALHLSTAAWTSAWSGSYLTCMTLPSPACLV